MQQEQPGTSQARLVAGAVSCFLEILSGERQVERQAFVWASQTLNILVVSRSI